MAGVEIPRGSELVGVDASDFERPGELMLTLAHPFTVERIFNPIKAGESAPRPMDTVSAIMCREPFSRVETGQGSVYVAADALGPDQLKKMAQSGKLSRDGGISLIGSSQVEPVKPRSDRNSWGFVKLENRAGVAPVVEEGIRTSSEFIPPQAEENAGAPASSEGDVGPGETGGGRPKGREEFPGWLNGRKEDEDGASDGNRLAEGVAGEVGGEAPPEPAAPVKPVCQPATKQGRAVQITVPSRGPAAWAQDKKSAAAARKAANPKPKPLVAGESSGLGIGNVSAWWGGGVLLAGCAALALVILMRSPLYLTPKGYYRWEKRCLEAEVKSRRGRYERDMQSRKDLQDLEREDRNLGQLSRLIEVMDERSR